ncbi:hypothetical protein [Natrinema saccharevitans]|uniref:hypothetical protein n=1 Tax=Natrinema saccharevitans TaxID=301967 RepID=UPI00111567F1|nr:hypothetical protein [Natrinema saccharevitans]
MTEPDIDVSREGPNGILTDSDRQYLLSQISGYDVDWSGDENQKRWRIREKIKAGFDDFRWITSLDDKEFELIFDDLGFAADVDEIPTGSVREILAELGHGHQQNDLQATLEVIYKACLMAPRVDFDRLVEQAVLNAESRWTDHAPGGKYPVSVDASVEVEYQDIPDVETIEEKLEYGERITREEIGELFLKGRIEPGDLSQRDIDTRILDEEHDEKLLGLKEVKWDHEEFPK